METEEDKEASYRYFDLTDCEFSDFMPLKKGPLKKNCQLSPHTQVVRLARNLPNCPAALVSARSRKIKAAAKAAKLKGEMKYLYSIVQK